MASNKFKYAIAVVLATASAGAFAASPGSPATSTLGVSASVNNKCSVTTSPVPFGLYDPVTANSSTGANLDATGTLNVTCTKHAGATAPNGGTAVSIALDFGANATASPRALINGTSDLLNYDLYLPSLVSGVYSSCTYTTVWDNATNVLTPASTFWDGSSHPITVCGRIPKGQVAAVGSYTDTVNVNVNF